MASGVAPGAHELDTARVVVLADVNHGLRGVAVVLDRPRHSRAAGLFILGAILLLLVGLSIAAH